MKDSPEDFDELPAPVTLDTIRAIQSSVELAMIQGLPVMNWHLLFGIIMLEETEASAFLKDHKITAEDILNKIPSFFPDDLPPF